METIRVFVGTEDAQFTTQQVLADSIRAGTKSRVVVKYCIQEAPRTGGTNFGYVRFMVPSMCQYSGRAIYLDADQVALADIQGLWESLSDDYSVTLVNDPEGSFGKKIVGKGNQTSVMVLNCERLTSWDPDTMFEQVVPNRAPLEQGQIHYRDFMQLTWWDQQDIQPLDPRWNHFNIINDDTKLVHFSHVRSQPWTNPSHPLTEKWAEFLERAIERGALSREELRHEIEQGNVDEWFLPYAEPTSTGTSLLSRLLHRALPWTRFQ